VGTPEGNRPLGRTRCRWGIILKHIIEKLDEVVWTGLIWLKLGQVAGFLNTVMNHRLP
jgi:hypothetical protein